MFVGQISIEQSGNPLLGACRRGRANASRTDERCVCVSVCVFRTLITEQQRKDISNANFRGNGKLCGYTEEGELLQEFTE